MLRSVLSRACSAVASRAPNASRFAVAALRQPASQQAGSSSSKMAAGAAALAALSAPIFVVYSAEEQRTTSATNTNFNQIRKEVADLLQEDDKRGPLLIRLAWHSSGTYDKSARSGGSCGATMRFVPESNWGANSGLILARQLLEPIKERHPGITYSDLWTLAGCVAIEEMGGPKIDWRPGRSDRPSGKYAPPDGTLPDASQGADHLRAIFYRMGFNDQEIVALSGAHGLGFCHEDRSGYKGPWTRAPTTFSNMYFTELFDNTWTKKKWDGPEQYEDPTGELMMLPTDLVIRDDPEFRKYALKYKDNEELFAKDFAAVFKKLIELGCNFDHVPADKASKAQSAQSGQQPTEQPKRFFGLF